MDYFDSENKAQHCVLSHKFCNFTANRDTCIGYVILWALDQVRHKLGCITSNGKWFENLYFEEKSN